MTGDLPALEDATGERRFKSYTYPHRLQHKVILHEMKPLTSYHTREPTTGSAINAAAQAPKPDPAKRDNLDFWQAWKELEQGERVSRRTGSSQGPWPYYMSHRAYMQLVGDRIEVTSMVEPGKMLCFEWKPSVEDLRADNWYVLE